MKVIRKNKMQKQRNFIEVEYIKSAHIRRVVACKALTSGSWAAHHWYWRRYHPAGHTWQRNRLCRRLKIKCVRNVGLDGRHVRFGLGRGGTTRVHRVRAWRTLSRRTRGATGHRRDHGGVHQEGFERHGERWGQRQTLLAGWKKKDDKQKKKVWQLMLRDFSTCCNYSTIERIAQKQTNEQTKTS